MNSHLNQLHQSLASKNLPALLVTHSTNISYLTSLPQVQDSEIVLLITKTTNYLLSSSLIYDSIKNLPGFKVVKLSSRASFLTTLSQLTHHHKLDSLGFESAHLSHSQFAKLKSSLKIKLFPTQDLIENLRLIKNPTEISHIRKSCRIAAKTMNFISRQLTPGLTEKHLAWKAENYGHNLGADGLAFPIIVASGPNSAIPHHITSNRKISCNDTILIDLGFKVRGFCSDMTRTFLIGTPTAKQKKVEQIVKQAYSSALESLTQNTSDGGRMDSSEVRNVSLLASKVDKAARSVIAAAGFAKYFPHGLGHGLGLEVHEQPSISSPVYPERSRRAKDQKLTANMVVTLEPGIYLPRRVKAGLPGKFGYRYENTVLITKTGCEVLTTTN